MSTAAIPRPRREPTQDRSAQRVELILDTTAELIDEVGFAAVSISQIAKRGGMSTPAPYRYFTDLQDIARALAARNVARFLARVNEKLADPDTSWQNALADVVGVYVEFFRSEPGFHWIRLGHYLDQDPTSSEERYRTRVVRVATELFVQRYDVDYRRDLLEHVEVIVEICESLLGRAFQWDKNGDQFYIDECVETVTVYLERYLAKPYPLVT